MTCIFAIGASAAVELKPGTAPKGSGTEEDPYLITSDEELCYIANQSASFKFKMNFYAKLCKDINLDYTVWLPISQKNHNNPFKGTFYGETNSDGTPKYSINYYTNDTAYKEDYLGLFAFAYKATFKDIAINICDNISGYGYIGGFVGYAQECSFENIVVTARNTKNPSKTPVITGVDNIGGICGNAASSTFENCSFDGSICVSFRYGGGICGSAKNTNFNNCTAKVTLDRGQSKETTIKTEDFGGITGFLEGGNITNCSVEYIQKNYNNNDKYFGGIAGQVLTANITGCYTKGDAIRGNQYVGGICGYYKSNSSYDYMVKNCTCDIKSVIGEKSAWGILGIAAYYPNATENCTFNGNINADSSLSGTVNVNNSTILIIIVISVVVIGAAAVTVMAVLKKKRSQNTQ